MSLITQLQDLPNWTGAKTIFLDLETTSGEDKEDSLNPWKNCDILGICLTVDSESEAVYVPLRHRNPRYNLDSVPVYAWLRDIISRAKIWVNSNVKYDAHVLCNCTSIDISHLKLVDLVTVAKILDSDRLSYGLKELSRALLHRDISEYEQEIRRYTHHGQGAGNIKCRDFAIIPADIMAPYGMQDALSARELYLYLLENISGDSLPTLELEVELTKVLFEIERPGTRLDLNALGRDLIIIPKRLSKIDEQLKKLVGRYFRPHASADCDEILCDMYDLPRIYKKREGKSEPTICFDKEVLKSYSAYPQAPVDVIELIAEYRHYWQLFNTFTLGYLRTRVKDRVYPDFNQAVRTGRMSQRHPNLQQVSPDAKRYILPDEGHVFLEFDLKQIEYRYVATYIENRDILKEYRENPAADYHQIMADRCGIERKPAKNMNFAVSFRAGKEKTIKMLKIAFDPSNVPAGMTFDQYCQKRGEEVYNAYHKAVPELRKEWDKAQVICQRRGYAKNCFGRRRHLKGGGAYMAFPNIIQSSAADLMKRITIRLHGLLKGSGLRIVAIIHDSWLISCPKELEEEWAPKIKGCIESTESKLDVPLYASMKRSEGSWGEIEEDE